MNGVISNSLKIIKEQDGAEQYRTEKNSKEKKRTVHDRKEQYRTENNKREHDRRE